CLMTLCILSDTHNNERAVAVAVRKIHALEPERVIHCGDIVAPKMLNYFRGLPITFVLGNCDSRASLNNAAAALDFPSVDSSFEFTLSGKSFFVTHGNNYSLIDRVIASQGFDYLLHGHTHLMADEQIERTRIICPGALYGVERCSFAHLDVVKNDLEFVEFDA
ncbi:YfcE family phosphodiesterase, partial [Oligoflexia bacterium]|nr:YfcE family phosphodiesterase [Oligoflexia bacterium]